MASTNKTTHYELSQYVGSDKPTYLTDYNNDMEAIDTGIYNAQTKADTAFANAGTADTKADTALLNAGTAITSAGTANSNIGTMANLTTTEKSSLVGAINEVNTQVGQNTTDIAKFNFTTFTSYNKSGVTNNSNGTLSECSLTLASNSDNSVIKLYGGFVVDGATSNGTITIPATRLRPNEEITVNPLGIRFGYKTNQGLGDCYPAQAKFKTNGDIEINFIASSEFWRSRTILMPCVIFLKQFGDTPNA